MTLAITPNRNHKMKQSRFSPLAIKLRQTSNELKEFVRRDGEAEYRLHCQIADLLRIFGVRDLRFWHTPNGGKRNPREASRFKSMGVLPGVVDFIISTPTDGMFFLEVKSPTGRLSKEQADFLDAMIRHGHKTAVVNSFDKAVAVLNTWGALKGVKRIA